MKTSVNSVALWLKKYSCQSLMTLENVIPDLIGNPENRQSRFVIARREWNDRRGRTKSFVISWFPSMIYKHTSNTQSSHKVVHSCYNKSLSVVSSGVRTNILQQMRSFDSTIFDASANLRENLCELCVSVAKKVFLPVIDDTKKSWF